MSYFCNILLNCIKNIDWSVVVTIITALAGIIVAVMAIIAVRIWKHQLFTQFQVKFIDDLNNSVQEYILAMVAPIEVLKYTIIGIQSYSEHLPIMKNRSKYSSIITFIKKNGKFEQEQIVENLNPVQPILSRMNSLLNKGQVFGFPKL